MLFLEEPGEKSDDRIYAINKILQRDYRDGQVFYKVHWERYGSECDTWYGFFYVWVKQYLSSYFTHNKALLVSSIFKCYVSQI